MTFVWEVLKPILAFAHPLQVLVAKNRGETHLFCNRQALIILENDGLAHMAEVLCRHWTALAAGTLWADQGWKFLSHYFNPRTGKGFSFFPPAAQECEGFFHQAVKKWRMGEREQALFYLGAATHLVQDLCVPYHACGVAFDGHQRYESWVRENHYLFKVEKGGYYQVAFKPGDWLYANASLAREYYPRICKEQEYPNLTAILLDLAQRTTAGFWAYFFSTI